MLETGLLDKKLPPWLGGTPPKAREKALGMRLVRKMHFMCFYIIYLFYPEHLVTRMGEWEIQSVYIWETSGEVA